MSALEKSLAERRASDPAFASTPSGTGSLLVHLWNGESWVFPWSQFVDGCLTGDPIAEELVLVFARKAVVICGRRLRKLLPEIAAFRVESLRGLPAEYSPLAGGGEPVIVEVRVLPLPERDDPPEKPH